MLRERYSIACARKIELTIVRAFESYRDHAPRLGRWPTARVDLS